MKNPSNPSFSQNLVILRYTFEHFFLESCNIEESFIIRKIRNIKANVTDGIETIRKSYPLRSLQTATNRFLLGHGEFSHQFFLLYSYAWIKYQTQLTTHHDTKNNITYHPIPTYALREDSVHLLQIYVSNYSYVSEIITS